MEKLRRQATACARVEDACRAQQAAAREATASLAKEAAWRTESNAAQRAETARVEALVASVQRECGPASAGLPSAPVQLTVRREGWVAWVAANHFMRSVRP